MHIHPSGSRLWCRQQDRTAVRCSAHLLPEAPAGFQPCISQGVSQQTCGARKTPSTETGLETPWRSKVTAARQIKSLVLPHKPSKKCVCPQADTPGGTGRTAGLGLWSPAAGLSLQDTTGAPQGPQEVGLHRQRPERDWTPLKKTQEAAGRAPDLRSPTRCAKGPRFPVPAAGDFWPRGKVWSLGQRSFTKTLSLKRRHHLGIQSFTE